MTDLSMVEIELSRHDWASLPASGGNADGVPTAVRGLLAAVDGEEARKFYWQLDNRVVVQGQLFESAVHLVPVLCAALTQELHPAARHWVLELLFQTTGDEPDDGGIEPGSLADRSRAAAREGIWLFYDELLHGRSAQADLLLDMVETDRQRYQHFRAQAAAAGRPLFDFDS